jgi:CHASE3 domain sensor protein
MSAITGQSPAWRARAQFLVIGSGLASVALGVIVIIGWHGRWSRLLQIFPDAAPMQYNTALCFVLCGAGLSLLSSRFAWVALGLGGLTALSTSLTLLEYLTGQDLGIDQLLFHPYFEVATAYPGRMAPLTAICFLLFGTTLGLSGAGKPRLKKLAAAGLLATVIGMTGFAAMLGYLTEMKMAYGWGAYSLMAFHTAIAFVVLATGMVLWCWQEAARQNMSFLRWVPIAASATLIVMVAVISVATVTSLRAALDWRKHTYEVLLLAESLLTGVQDLQRGARGYALSGRPDSRAAYQAEAENVPRQLARLTELTRDNPVQQERLKEVTMGLSNLLSYNSKLITARSRDGFPEAVALESDGEGEQTMNRAVSPVHAFIEEEQRLLIQRSTVANNDFRNTARLLGVGTALAAIFLAMGALLVHREVIRRHRAELELLKLADDVKTLSGLLPICSHCKSIRDDKGYWNRIEAYLQEHSEATFSHGLCENCVRELYPAIADRVLSKMREESQKNG